MATEAQVRAALLHTDQLAAEHPTWTAFGAFAAGSQALYDASRLAWRAQSPAIDVAAQEGAYGYDVAPGLPTVRAARGQL